MMPKARPPEKLKISIGIDPGVNGGLVAINLYSAMVLVDPMPETEREVWEWFNGFNTNLGHAIPAQASACIEWIHPAIQGTGKASMSKLYGSYMRLRMCLIAAGIPFEDVKPKDWQRAVGISPRKKTEDTTQWKNRLRAKAQELYPKLEIWKGVRNKGKQMAIADALLIAHYGMLKQAGRLK